ncbi:hypothetical protein, partial [uncultured Desulfovibrio sp.]|uniref:hypothetical protein n=1 Tax=uncultured Desulfovibrio sp. TaxID=167968 RepID=UPI0026DBB23C
MATPPHYRIVSLSALILKGRQGATPARNRVESPLPLATGGPLHERPEHFREKAPSGDSSQWLHPAAGNEKAFTAPMTSVCCGRRAVIAGQ